LFSSIPISTKSFRGFKGGFLKNSYHFKNEIFIVPKFTKSLFNMFTFWFFDAKMAIGWDIGFEKKSKIYPIGCSILRMNLSMQKNCFCLILVISVQVI